MVMSNRTKGIVEPLNGVFRGSVGSGVRRQNLNQLNPSLWMG